MQAMSCALTYCRYTVFPVITTSRKLRDPLLTLRGEPYGFGFPAGRTPDDDHPQPSRVCRL
jgi:hypothetical protein